MERHRQPWYNEYIKQQKTVVKNQEWKWTKYRLETNWKNYKKERNIYNRMIKSSKQQKICEKINESSNDAKKLYALINHLSGCTQENPLPTNKSDEILVEEFADFFINKIKTIREKFKRIDCYHHQPVDAPMFRKFRPMTESEISNIIMSMKSKSCELDPILTTLKNTKKMYSDHAWIAFRELFNKAGGTKGYQTNFCCNSIQCVWSHPMEQLAS